MSMNDAVLSPMQLVKPVFELRFFKVLLYYCNVASLFVTRQTLENIRADSLNGNYFRSF